MTAWNFKPWKPLFTRTPTKGMWVIATFVTLPIYMLRIAQYPHELQDPWALFTEELVVPVRIIISFPLFWVGKSVIEKVTDAALVQIRRAKLILPENMNELIDLIHRHRKARSSVVVDLIAITIAITIAVAGIKFRLSYAHTTALLVDREHIMSLSWAGWWYVLVFTPVTLFVGMRSILAWILWIMSMTKLRKLPLQLNATHPDNAGGIGFLGLTTAALIPTVMALAASIEGVWFQTLRKGIQSPQSLFIPGLGLVAATLLFTFGPFLMWTGLLTKVRSEWLIRYGAVGNLVVSRFHEKWAERLSDFNPDEFLESPSGESTANFCEIYEQIEEMRFSPFSLLDVKRIVIAVVVPAIPLILTVIPLKELIAVIVKFVG